MFYGRPIWQEFTSTTLTWKFLISTMHVPMSRSLYKVSYTNIYSPPCHRHQQNFRTRAQHIPSTSITINSLSLTATKRPVLLVLCLQELGAFESDRRIAMHYTTFCKILESQGCRTFSRMRVHVVDNWRNSFAYPCGLWARKWSLVVFHNRSSYYVTYASYYSNVQIFATDFEIFTRPVSRKSRCHKPASPKFG
jgi:hypothetical protein